MKADELRRAIMLFINKLYSAYTLFVGKSLVSVMLLKKVSKHLLVVVQSKHSVVEAGKDYIGLLQKNESYSRMTQSNISQSGGSKTPLGWQVVRTNGVANQSWLNT